MHKPLHKNYLAFPIWVLLALAGLWPAGAQAQTCPLSNLTPTGIRDSCFVNGVGFNEAIYTMALQADGRLLVGGGFTAFDGDSARRIIRLTEEQGHRDSSFTTGTGFDGAVRAIVVQPNGKILVGGEFKNYNGVAASHLIRLNADGTKDNTFRPDTLNGAVYAIALQPDGRIMLGGGFTKVGTATANHIVRLNATGSRNTTFAVGVGFNLNVYAITIQPDGKMLVGGSFSAYQNGLAGRFIRLNANGTQDFAFQSGAAFNSTVFAITLDSMNRIYVGGQFITYNNQTANQLIRLKPNGTVDSAFNVRPFSNSGTVSVQAIHIQTDDGRLLIGGTFARYGGTLAGDIVRLDTTGAFSRTFAVGTNIREAANYSVNALVQQRDRKIIVGGTFVTYRSRPVGRIVRIFGLSDCPILAPNFRATVACAGQQSIFRNLSASVPGTRYFWNFGDSTTSSLRELRHTFARGGNYTVTLVAVNDSCSDSAKQTIFIPEAPARPTITIGGDTVLTSCDGDSVLLTSSAAPHYLWSTGDTTQSILARQGGIYTVRVRDSVGNCYSDTSLPVRIYSRQAETPSIEVDGEPTFCQGDSVTLTSTFAEHYRWSTGDTTQSITVSLTGAYTVQVQNGDSCFSLPADSVFINALPLPDTVYITPSGPTTFCQGDSVVLTANEALAYLWSTGDTTRSITVRDSGTYSVAVGNALCTFDSSASITITVNPRAAAPLVTASRRLNADGTLTLCGRDSVVLTSSVETGNLWSTGDTTQTITVRGPGRYRVAITGSPCISDSSDALVIYNDSIPMVPLLTLSGPTTFCDGDSVVLTAFPSSVFWSTGDTTESIQVFTSGEYFAYGVSEHGCRSAASDTVDVIVNPVPERPSITLSGTTFFCLGDSVVLTASFDSLTVDSTIRFLWSTGDTTRSIVVDTTGLYTVQLVSGSGCASTAAAPVSVFVVDPNVAPIITIQGDTTFCQGDSVILSSNAPLGNVWSTGDTSRVIVVSTSGRYSVKVVGPTCETIPADSVTILVNPRPVTPIITSAGRTAVCLGDSVTLTASGDSLLADSVQHFVWSTGDTGRSITVTTSGSYTVTLSVDSVVCSSFVSAPVQVLFSQQPQQPVITSATGSLTICDGGSITLSAATDVATSYVWSTGDSTQSIVVSDTAARISVTAYNGGCASAPSDTVEPGFSPRPSAAFTFEPAGPDGAPVVLRATDTTTGLTYSWFTIDGGDTTLVSDADTALAESDGDYTLLVTNAGGCQDTLTQFVRVSGVAKAFSLRVSLSPNPARETVRVRYDGFKGASRLQLIDARGVNVYGATLPGGKAEALVPVHGLPMGLYLIQITDRDGRRWQGRLAVE